MPRIEELTGPRILAGVAADLEITVYADGIIAAPTNPSVVVLDGADDTVPAVVSATGAVLKATIAAADNNRPRVYNATWTFTQAGTDYTVRSVHESVGELLFTEAEARVYDDQALGDTAKYSGDTILRARDQIHDAFEDIIGVGLGGRWRRDTLDGMGFRYAMLPRLPVQSVVSVSERVAGSLTWTPYNADDLADIFISPPGTITREGRGLFTSGLRNVVVEYTYGLSPIPLDLRRAALRLARFLLVPSDLDDRTMSTTNQFGNQTLAVAGIRSGAWYGIPPVDSTLQFYRDRYRIPSFA